MDWHPIETAPTSESVIVSNRASWTLAKRIWVTGQTLQCKWPFIKDFGWWAWVYSCSGARQIDFEPTHWAALDITPPPNPATTTPR